MMKRALKGFLLGMLLVLAACAPKLAMYRQNQEFIYDPVRHISHDMRREGDSLHLFLQIHHHPGANGAGPPIRQLKYLVNLSYERQEVVRRDSVPGINRRVQYYPEFAYIPFKIALTGLHLPAVLQVQVLRGLEAFWFDIPLNATNTARDFVLRDSTRTHPLFRHYLQPGEPFFVDGVHNGPVSLRQYEGDFPAALPPFSPGARQVAPALALLATTTISHAGPIQIKSPGLYLLTAGSASASVVVAENAYPALVTARDLIEPLVYLTTTRERETLYKAQEPKQALDQFWLQAAGQDKALAKKMIRLYYERVEISNQFFTSHKPGWQTDRGMVYVVFGKPQGVYRRQESEEWVYTRTRTRPAGPDIKFIFIKKPNTFTALHYELVRNPDYEFLWYSIVEKWRKGTILEE